MGVNKRIVSLPVKTVQLTKFAKIFTGGFLCEYLPIDIIKSNRLSCFKCYHHSVILVANPLTEIKFTFLA